MIRFKYNRKERENFIMKKKNGFTLIELLAVIIILGVLMLVAIPSVTSYINNSRKSAYADTAANYIKGATNLVNEGQRVQAYDENTLYLIPAGHDKTVSCVALESGGQSPYNTVYKMAYVGVTYDNAKGSYNYYFTAVDGSGQGFTMKSSYKISSSKSGEGSALVSAGLSNYGNKLQEIYAAGGESPASGTGKINGVKCMRATGTKTNCASSAGDNQASNTTLAGADNALVDGTVTNVKDNGADALGIVKVVNDAEGRKSEGGTDTTIEKVVIFAASSCQG
jgi:prepilin-type N-terminal cleavage/methylation domain-containing protein